MNEWMEGWRDVRGKACLRECLNSPKMKTKIIKYGLMQCIKLLIKLIDKKLFQSEIWFLYRTQQFETLSDFYTYYLCEHSLAKTKLFHFIGTFNVVAFLATFLNKKTNGAGWKLLVFAIIQVIGTPNYLYRIYVIGGDLLNFCSVFNLINCFAPYAKLFALYARLLRSFLWHKSLALGAKQLMK